MSETKWTNEQLDAITEKGCNILVAAAAGAGKTAVLVERIIRKITDTVKPIDIDKLLIVTFTNAAAAEMRERIGDAVTKALDANPESKQLQRQLTLLNKASITTMHSFCLEVVRSNFHMVDLDPDFRIADQTEAALMKMEALEELFEDMYTEENTDENFLNLVECYGGGRGDQALMDMVLHIYEFVQSYPWPQKWLQQHVEDFYIPPDSHFAESKWAKVLMDNIRIEVSDLSKLLKRAARIASQSGGLAPYITALNSDIAMIDAIEALCFDEYREGKWDELYRAFSEIDFQRLPRCGKDVDKMRQEQVKGIREEAKKRIKKIQQNIFSIDPRQAEREIRDLYPLMKSLADLVTNFTLRYAAKKRERSLLDFNDLEHYCLKILTKVDENGAVVPSDTAALLRERYEEILVDEYQDSNLVQEVIINSISRKEPEAQNVFMVGDVKQSIYRFRQARPELFLEKYNTYPEEKGFKNRKILLYKNFRSREEIINGVNFVFKQIMSRGAGELDYDDNEALKPGAVYKPLDETEGQTGGPVEFHLIDASVDASDSGDADNGARDNGATDNDITNNFADGVQINGDTDGETAEPLDDIQVEARIVINRIKEFLEPSEEGKQYKIYDKSIQCYRNVQYKDIVILLRTTQNWAEIFVEELTNHGIPVYADTAAGFFKTVEVQVMLSLLQVIDNPLQDIPLLSVLRSPIANFTPDELVDIRLADQDVPFYEAMTKLASEGDGSTAEKARDFLESLERWRDKSLYMSTDELIWYLYSETGYYSYVGAMPGGAQRQANLRSLFEKARQYENTSYRGLFNFINFIDRLKESKGDMGSAKTVGENENVVRIMSIHKSKGLEFPIVFVSGCGKRLNTQDINASILIHQDLGFGPDYVDCERRIVHSTIPKEALRCRLRQETISEELRILYVAFTRAREKLIITGLVKGANKAAARWCECADTDSFKLSEYEILKGTCYLDWIGPALARHKDCEEIRELAGIGAGERKLLDDGSRWSVKLWNKSDITADRFEEKRTEVNILEQIENLDTEKFDTEHYEDVLSRLGWKYKHQLLSRIPTKVSVTELKRHFGMEISEELSIPHINAPVLVKKPLFLEGDVRISAAEKGTLLHFVMQHLELGSICRALDICNDGICDDIYNNDIYNGDIRNGDISNESDRSTISEYKHKNDREHMYRNGVYKSDIVKKEIEAQIEKMIEQEFLTKQQAVEVDTGIIAAFFFSPIGRRMLKAGKINREKPFYLELSCDEISGFAYAPDVSEQCVENGKLPDNETVLLQGVIDCYFEDEEGLVLLDYKTDYIPSAGKDVIERIIKDRYFMQMEYYSRALEKILGRKVDEKYIYLFWNGQLVSF
ncbi:MAG TPA: UvrD-helicase domain-containing protein [Clostridiaceae bacterium]|nr:UvrD-helicase domain-containing protein [Clostridiaceae bacterium]